ncbi:PGN_0703 family putative restriction endonuclease [Methylorubrum extorquens]|uniref:PGN_0703 family putative restriction endonuclease n=1 Tax=Methylorubrum extorquens TaxID=408 RepID=UPI003F603FD4
MADFTLPTAATLHDASADPFVTRLPHSPALPAALRKAHGAFISTDSRFAAAARVLASLWRADRDLPAGVHVTRGADGKTRRVRAGYRLRADAARAGAAFLEPATRAFLHRALVLRESGSAWDVPKIQGHLLSSQGLLINLLAPLARNQDLATAVFRALLPDTVHAITGITVESSIGRDDPALLGDGTAWDARIDFVDRDGIPGLIGLECKYVENLQGPAASPRDRYREVARASGLFIDPDAPALYRPGLEQLRREHSLLHLALARGLAGRAHFVLLGPALNPRVAAAAQAYRAHLVDPAGAQSGVGFTHLTLEAVVTALAAAGATDRARAFHARYLDLDRVAALALGPDSPATPSSPPPTGPAAPLLLPPPPQRTETAPVAKSPATSSRPRRKPTQRRRNTTNAPRQSVTASQLARASAAQRLRLPTTPPSATLVDPTDFARITSSGSR